MREKQTVTKTLTVVFDVELKEGDEMHHDFQSDIMPDDLEHFIAVWGDKVVEVRLK